jgi:SEC-C motif-containing protein
LAGFSEFLRALERDWRTVVRGFVPALAAASLAWFALAPVYAAGLAVLAQAAAPLIERTPDARYAVEGSRVVIHRPLVVPGETAPRDLAHTVWLAAGAFGIPVFAAFVIVTPGWSWSTRMRALGLGLAFLTVTQIGTVLVTIGFWQEMPVRGPAGQALYLPGHSAARLRVLSAAYYFLEIMGRGFFVLGGYVALLSIPERAWRSPRTPAGRNAPCPCGSGEKFKRCCGVSGS